MFFRIEMVLLCSVNYHMFFFVGDKVAAEYFKDEIIYLLKEKYRLKLSLDVSLNNARYKGIPRCKLSYKLFYEQDVDDQLLDISLTPISI